MSFQDCFEHFRLGQFLAEALDHGDLVPRAGDDKIEVTLRDFLGGRERNELPVNPSQSNGTDRPEEGNVRSDRQRGRSADDGEDVGVIDPVGRDRARLDLDLHAIVGRKKGPDGAVDEARGEDLLGGGPAFSLDKPAGELTGRVDFLSVVHRQRKEVQPFPAGCDDGGDESHCVANAHNDGSGRLLGKTTSLDGNCLVPESALGDDMLLGWIHRTGCDERGHAHPYLMSAGLPDEGATAKAGQKRPAGEKEWE